MKKDYCTLYPEIVQGKDIGSTCCKKHDNEVGQAGTYNPITPHINFYKCLREKGIIIPTRISIVIVASVFSIIKYPYFVVLKYKYRKKHG